MIIRYSTRIIIFSIREIGKLNTYSPIYCTKYYWEHWLKSTLPRHDKNYWRWRTHFLYCKFAVLSFHDTGMTRVVDILSHGRQAHAYARLAYSISSREPLPPSQTLKERSALYRAMLHLYPMFGHRAIGDLTKWDACRVMFYLCELRMVPHFYYGNDNISGFSVWHRLCVEQNVNSALSDRNHVKNMSTNMAWVVFAIDPQGACRLHIAIYI